MPDIKDAVSRLSTKLKWMVNLMLQTLCLWEKSLWYPLNRRVNGSQGHSGYDSEEKDSIPTDLSLHNSI